MIKIAVVVSCALALFSTQVVFSNPPSFLSAANTHVGADAEDLIVLSGRQDLLAPQPRCSQIWDRRLPTGNEIDDFEVPANKVIVVTEIDWRTTGPNLTPGEVVTFSITFPGATGNSQVVQSVAVIPDSPPESSESPHGTAFGNISLTTGFVIDPPTVEGGSRSLNDWMFACVRPLTDGTGGTTLIRGYLTEKSGG